MNATPKNISELIARASAGADVTKVANMVAELRGGADVLASLIAAAQVIQRELDEREEQARFMMLMDAN